MKQKLFLFLFIPCSVQNMEFKKPQPAIIKKKAKANKKLNIEVKIGGLTAPQAIKLNSNIIRLYTNLSTKRSHREHDKCLFLLNRLKQRAIKKLTQESPYIMGALIAIKKHMNEARQITTPLTSEEQQELEKWQNYITQKYAPRITP